MSGNWQFGIVEVEMVVVKGCGHVSQDDSGPTTYILAIVVAIWCHVPACGQASEGLFVLVALEPAMYGDCVVADVDVLGADGVDDVFVGFVVDLG